MRSARVLAQAKINLFLAIGARRAEGYHDLATQFQRIDLADEVTVRFTAKALDRSLDCAGPMLPAAGLGPVETNLAYRAAVAFVEAARMSTGFAIEIRKHIPVGGGLGGGSADAGAVLRILHSLSGASLDSDALTAIARSLGADVPFLAGEWPGALGAGTGDRLIPVDALPSRELLLAVPDFAISTADAYRWLDESRAGGQGATGAGSLAPAAPADLAGISGGARTWDEARGMSRNDFEAVLEPRFPRLRQLREALSEAGAGIARLSGSGSTVFGVFSGAAPDAQDLDLDALVITTRTSSRVVQVEAQE